MVWQLSTTENPSTALTQDINASKIFCGVRDEKAGEYAGEYVSNASS
jgi:hypothetical protein